MPDDGQAEGFAIRKGKEARAWRRALLDENGNLHADGKAILGSLMRFSQYFGVGYVPGDHDRTLIIAARRELVNRIFALLDYDESNILAIIRESRDDD